MTKRLLLKGKSAAFIDWANVYGWTKSLKREVDPDKLFGKTGYCGVYDGAFGQRNLEYEEGNIQGRAAESYGL